MDQTTKAMFYHIGGFGKLGKIGAYHLATIDEQQTIKFMFKGCNKANFCQIRLNENNLYSLAFGICNLKHNQTTKMRSIENCTAEMLVQVFENYTGLFLSQ